MRELSVIGLRGFPCVQGGVEVHCENLYPRFSEDVKVTVYRRKSYLSKDSQKKYPRISFVDFYSTKIKGLETLFHTFISSCHVIARRPDAVHVHNIGPGLFIPMLKLFGLRVCMTYHSPNYEHKKWGVFAKTLLKFGEWLSLNFADEVVFVNKFQMDKVGSKYSGKSHYIPNGVNVTSKSESDDFIRRYGLKSHEYVLAVGRITQEKGFDVLIKAITGLPDVKHLVIAGASDHDKAYYEKLKSLDTYNKVVFTGFTTGEDLRQLYSHAGLFVLSSFNEGFPLVLLEAMGYKLPLVVSDIPATHLLKLDAEDYVTSGDVNGFATAIKDKWINRGDEISYDLSEYDWRSIASQTENIIMNK